ncbi:WD40-repeat-containing domain protein [Dipodascopsis tothii]|uniref:WD40-repeat-containing domain protein n=1 Tax=Dipodascopsis tothii TaxID=44089 RepID=UPI0034CE7A75
MAKPFKLAAALEGHKGDARGVTFPAAGTVVSVSRDSTLRTWTAGAGDWLSDVDYESPKYVNSVAWIGGEEGLVAAGGQDASIAVLATALPGRPLKYTLSGHDSNVCALHAAHGQLISGSWDKTARVWQDGVLKHTLAGHTQAIWAVLILGPDVYVTGAADKTIRIWNGSTVVRTLSAHEDVVRGLCAIPGGFASCSNDASIRTWTAAGEPQLTLYGHTNFIYAVAALPSGELLSASEDRSVRVWSGAECVQTITHPCVSVWAVAACADSGDIVSGASDGVVRVFSRDAGRWAAPAVLAAFDERVASFGIAAAELGGINKEKLAGKEALAVPGTKLGEVKMVRAAGTVDAYQWSGSEWDKIGEVVDSVGSQRKQIYEGQEYDFVFDVDIQEGAPPLKLPYRVNENPYDAARRFLERNELPLEYLDQTAQFIEQNTAGVQIGATAPAEDPYGSRYIPGQAAAAPPPTRPAPKLMPQRSFLFFQQIKLPAVAANIAKTNAAVGADALAADDLAALEATLGAATPDGLRSHWPALSAPLLHIAASWPVDKRLAALDVLRIAVAGADATGLAATVTTLFAADSFDPAAPNTAMMALRVLANAFGADAGGSVLADPDIVDQVAAVVRRATPAGPTKLLQVALATLVLNYAVHAVAAADTDTAFALVDPALGLLPALTDAEAKFRGLVALGTLCAAGAEVAEGVRSLGGAQAAATAAEATSDPRVSAAATELRQLLA